MLELSHKKLIAWQEAILLLPLIYDLCKKLTKEETYNLSARWKEQGVLYPIKLQRVLLVKQSPTKIVFEIARSSVIEIDNCLTACIVLRFLTKEDIVTINASLLEVFKLITGLIDSNKR